MAYISKRIATNTYSSFLFLYGSNYISVRCMHLQPIAPTTDPLQLPCLLTLCGKLALSHIGPKGWGVKLWQKVHEYHSHGNILELLQAGSHNVCGSLCSCHSGEHNIVLQYKHPIRLGPRCTYDLRGHLDYGRGCGPFDSQNTQEHLEISL
jgi:hypothetical protein